jgi:hypothetical protein
VFADAVAHDEILTLEDDEPLGTTADADGDGDDTDTTDGDADDADADDSDSTDSSSLERAIAPVAVERFLAEHWERQPLVVPRHESGRFDDLLSVRDVERLVTETALRTPAFRLVQAGEQLGRYTTELSWRPEPFTGVADVRRVLAAFEAIPAAQATRVGQCSGMPPEGCWKLATIPEWIRRRGSG